jgi:hypothetical protein
MDIDELRRWLVSEQGTSALDIDLDLLDPSDEDDRELLVLAQHPQLAAAIERGEDEIDVDGVAVNPYLHLAMHEIVAIRLWTDEPPGFREKAERLLHDGCERHEAMHILGAEVMGDILQALSGRPTDEEDEEDEQGPDQDRERLLEGYRRWVTQRGLPGDDWVAAQILDFKESYLGGGLGCWRVADLDELFLYLYPRKVVLGAEDLPEVLPATGRFLEFLGGNGMLAPGSDPLPRLLRALKRLSGPFLAEMQNPASFGMAKSLFAGMATEGVDPTDRASVDAWIRDFNARSYAERDRILSQGSSPGTAPVLGLAALPDDDALAAEALTTRAMRQLTAFLAWIGDDGRALTQKGHLRLADGKELIGLLGTSDRFDVTIGDRTFKTHSTSDLPEVDLVYRLSLKARLARRQRGGVQRTKRGAQLAGGRLGIEGLQVWSDVVKAMLALGLIGTGREDRYGRRWWWQDEVDAHGADLLFELAVAGEPVPVSELAEAAMDGLAESYDLDSLSHEVRALLPESVEWGIGRLADRLEWLGVATRDEVVFETDLAGHERRTGGQVALTDLGRWFVRPILRDRGFRLAPEAPAVSEPDDLAGLSAIALVQMIATWPEEAGREAVQVWGSGRDTAVEELAAAARRAPTPDERALALEALEAFGEQAEPAVRALLKEPAVWPFAALWLVNLGFEKPEFLNPQDTPAAFVQVLAVALISDGAAAVPEVFEAHGDVEQQLRVLEGLWRVDDPYTEPVLEALASSSNRQVAKAARKALFKRRSARN